MKTLTNYLLEY